MHALRGVSVSVDKKELLAQLKNNRERHGKIVAEARDGYIVKAREALEKRLGQLRDGKLVSLSFHLSPPQDHTKEYDTIIQMLELHIDDNVQLSASQVRNFFMDEWDWKHRFLATNALYSKMASDEVGEET